MGGVLGCHPRTVWEDPLMAFVGRMPDEDAHYPRFRGVPVRKVGTVDEACGLHRAVRARILIRAVGAHPRVDYGRLGEDIRIGYRSVSVHVCGSGQQGARLAHRLPVLFRERSQKTGAVMFDAAKGVGYFFHLLLVYVHASDYMRRTVFMEACRRVAADGQGSCEVFKGWRQ